MQFHDALRRETGVVSHVGEVGAGIAAIPHRDFDGAGFDFGRGFGCGEALPDQAFDLGGSAAARVEINEHGGKGRMEVEDSRRQGREAPQKTQDLTVGLKRDLFAETDKQ